MEEVHGCLLLAFLGRRDSEENRRMCTDFWGTEYSVIEKCGDYFREIILFYIKLRMPAYRPNRDTTMDVSLCTGISFFFFKKKVFVGCCIGMGIFEYFTTWKYKKLCSASVYLKKKKKQQFASAIYVNHKLWTQVWDLGEIK